MDPFQNNRNYTSVWKLQSRSGRCTNIEKVELYRHKTDNHWALFKYIVDNGSNTMPVRLWVKFDTLLYSEVTQTPTAANLFIITGYKDLNMVYEKVNICCSDLSFVLQVEKALTDSCLT
jgi:hypothetical protein